MTTIKLELGDGLRPLADALAKHRSRTFAPRAWLRRAAVAVVLREGAAGVELLLARRAKSRGDRWSGHLAFPGGLAAPGDIDARATAVRETLEETGLDLAAHALPMGQLSELLTASHGSLAPLCVVPVVFALVRPAEVVPSAELVAAFWVPLRELLEARRKRSRLGRALGWFLPARGEPLAPTPLWGLTLAMVDELSRLAGAAEQ